MKKMTFYRVLLPAFFMLLVSHNANAQLGWLLNKAAGAAGRAVGKALSGSKSSGPAGSGATQERIVQKQDDVFPIEALADYLSTSVESDNSIYTLRRSSTIEGLKCDHFEYKGKRFRRFVTPKGSYIMTPEDEDDLDISPKNLEFSKSSFYIHHDSIDYYHTAKLQNLIWVLLPHGDVVEMEGNADNLFPSNTNDVLKRFLSKEEDDREDYGLNSLKMKRMYVAKDKKIYNYSEDMSGFRIGDRLWDFVDGDVRAGLRYKGFQVVTIPIQDRRYGYVRILPDEVRIPTPLTDTIVAANRVFKDDKVSYRMSVRYSNGDSIVQVYRITESGSNYYIQGKVHRKGGEITYNNETYQIKKDDGTLYKGEIVDLPIDQRGYRDPNKLSEFYVFGLDDIKPYYGEVVYADGRTDTIKEGITESEKAARRKAIEEEVAAEEKAAEAARIKKNKEAQQKLYSMFGKKYADDAAAGRVTVGMPEVLLVGAFKTELVYQSATRKRYNVYGTGWTNGGRTYSDTVLLKTVWVSNGKVTSVTNF